MLEVIAIMTTIFWATEEFVEASIQQLDVLLSLTAMVTGLSPCSFLTP